MTTMASPSLLRVMVLILIAATATQTWAVGISIDAGLTPPEGRWILRTQVRAMSRVAPDGTVDASMDRLMVPFVVVYGLRPQLTLGLRQIVESRSMTMNGNENSESGLADLYFFAKYKVLRVNTRSYTLGIAPLLGIEAPTGSSGISSESWDLVTGLLVSGRTGMWGADLNIGYGIRGMAGVPEGDPDPGNEWGLDLAIARQIPVGDSGQASLAPVLELIWRDTAPDAIDGTDVPNTGESVFSVAPGLKYTLGDLIIEGLVRFPVAQEQTGMQLEVRPMYLLGIRHMF